MAELLPIILIAVAFWFLLIRPQQKQRKRLQQVQSSLDVGDEVMTQAGFFGTVRGFDDRDRVLLEIADGVTVTVVRGAVVSQDQKPESEESSEESTDEADEEGTEAGTEERGTGGGNDTGRDS